LKKGTGLVERKRMWRVESKKEQAMEGEFGEEAPKSGQKMGT